MGDDRTEEHNDPRDVNPKQKEWRSSKGTVNETEAGLSHDCRECHASDSEGGRREETPDNRVPEGDLTIGDCRISSGQSDRADHEGQQAHQYGADAGVLQSAPLIGGGKQKST